MKSNILENRGFTLIEILVVITILTILAAIIFVSFTSLGAKEALDNSAGTIISTLREARSLTLASDEANQYGVRLEQSRVILFRGPLYSALDPENLSYGLSSLTGARNIALNGGGSEVVFMRLTGATEDYGSLEVYLKSAATTYKKINVNKTGLIEIAP